MRTLLNLYLPGEERSGCKKLGVREDLTTKEQLSTFSGMMELFVL